MKNLIPVLLCSVFLLTGCQTAEQLRMAQVAEEARHVFNAPTDKLYPAVVQAFVESGCSIKNSDKDAGLVEVQCKVDTNDVYKASVLIKQGPANTSRVDLENKSCTAYIKQDNGQVQRQDMFFCEGAPYWDSVLDQIHAKVDGR